MQLALVWFVGAAAPWAASAHEDVPPWGVSGCLGTPLGCGPPPGGLGSRGGLASQALIGKRGAPSPGVSVSRGDLALRAPHSDCQLLVQVDVSIDRDTEHGNSSRLQGRGDSSRSRPRNLHIPFAGEDIAPARARRGPPRDPSSQGSSAGSAVAGLIAMTTAVRTSEKASVLVIVFLIILVPVVLAATLLFFMCAERRKAEPGLLDPLGSQVAVPTRRDSIATRRSSICSSRRRSIDASSLGGLSQFKSRSGSCASTPSPFCSELIVDNPRGMALLINGQFEPNQQEEVVEVTSADASGEVVVRALMSETGMDSGVLLESGHRIPIAFLHTHAAVGLRVLPSPRGGRPSPRGGQRKGRHVLVSRVSGLADQSGGHPNDDMDFALVQVTEGNVVVMTRGGEPGGALLLAVHVRPGSRRMTVADAASKLVASVGPRRDGQQGPLPQQVLNVEHGVDVALVLCALISAVKLGDP